MITTFPLVCCPELDSDLCSRPKRSTSGGSKGISIWNDTRDSSGKSSKHAKVALTSDRLNWLAARDLHRRLRAYIADPTSTSSTLPLPQDLGHLEKLADFVEEVDGEICAVARKEGTSLTVEQVGCFVQEFREAIRLGRSAR